MKALAFGLTNSPSSGRGHGHITVFTRDSIYAIMKLFTSSHNGYLAGYLAIWLYCVILCIEWWCCTILHLHCSFVPCASGHSFPYDIVFQVFTSYTGVQSVSCVLLWQPSECVHLIVNCVILLLENKYDDDDAR